MARNHVFMTTRALHGYESITDGKTFSPFSVFQICGKKKPGLSTLSHFHKMMGHRSVKEIALDVV